MAEKSERKGYFVYLSEDEKQTIDNSCIKAGLNFSQFMRYKMLEVCREDGKEC